MLVSTTKTTLDPTLCLLCHPHGRGALSATYHQRSHVSSPLEKMSTGSRATLLLSYGRATLCDMRIVTHREMRNQSGEILRYVADGETIQVTNNGLPAALIVPPGADALTDLVSRGQVRLARSPVSSLRSIARRPSTTDSKAIVTDVRGRW